MPTVGAWSSPFTVIKLFTIFFPAAAVSAILPPAAFITPVLVTVCELTSSLTATSIKPSPYKSTVAVSPDAKCTRPKFAVITPLFSTFGATKPTKPPSFAVIVPRLIIDALGLPALSKTNLPSLKFWLLISAVVAIMLLILTSLPPPNKIPLVFTIMIFPLAVSLPKIWLGALLFTRLSATDFESG